LNLKLFSSEGQLTTTKVNYIDAPCWLMNRAGRGDSVKRGV